MSKESRPDNAIVRSNDAYQGQEAEAATLKCVDEAWTSMMEEAENPKHNPVLQSESVFRRQAEELAQKGFPKADSVLELGSVMALDNMQKREDAFASAQSMDQALRNMENGQLMTGVSLEERRQRAGV